MTADPSTAARTRWPGDIALGVRLAIGDVRNSWVRLVLTTVGIGLAIALLLLAASVNHIIGAQETRAAALVPDQQPIAGVAPVRYADTNTFYRGTQINGRYLIPTGPTSPVPAGLPRMPGPNEVVLSPALDALLSSPDGALLRPRFPQRVIGTIGMAGLAGSQDLTFVAGLAPELASPTMRSAYSFGVPLQVPPLDGLLRVMVALGAVALLIPVMIMIAMSSRIAGAQRDRRLAALRLIGAGARQVRRIAAAESLVGAATGVAFGAGLFLVARQVIAQVSVLGQSVFAADVIPSWPDVVVIALLVPLMAVGTALIALRGVEIAPLGVVRASPPARRRLWWRVVPPAVGVAALVAAAGADPASTTFGANLLLAGSFALLAGVPILLPWLVERTVSRLRGGPPSWQLAIRRLQLDSGTAARVVGGVAIVVAAAITLQTVTMATAVKLNLSVLPGTAAPPAQFLVRTTPSASTQVAAAVHSSPVVKQVYPLTIVDGTRSPSDPHANRVVVQIASCDALRVLDALTSCTDGDVFLPPDSNAAPDTELTLLQPSATPVANPVADGQWRIPATPHRLGALPPDAIEADVLTTPGALPGFRPAGSPSAYAVQVDPAIPDAAESVRNAVAAFPLTAHVEDLSHLAALDRVQHRFVDIRNGFLVGSLFTLMLAGVGLLVSALEQVRERRRPLAILAASGVPRAVLARSLLWQTAVPVGVGMAAAVVTGIGLAQLVLRLDHAPPMVDWPGVALFVGVATALVLTVTAATLPTLRGATRLTALRTE